MNKATCDTNKTIAAKDVKSYIGSSGVRCWQVADALNIADRTLCRRLRYPVSEESFQRIKEAVNEIKKKIINK